MVLAMLQLGELDRAKLVLSFMLDALQDAPRVAHVITADPLLQHASSLDLAEQTDGSFHLMIAYARYVTVANDTTFRDEHYPLIRKFLNSYVAPGAATEAGVLYFNSSGLMFNPNLEHSRCGHYWTTFDILTNSFAVTTNPARYRWLTLVIG